MTSTPNEKIDTPFSEAISMIGYEGKLIWTVFRSILSANAFLVSFFIAIKSFMPGTHLAIDFLPYFGLFLCAIWYLATIRMFDYYRFWFAWARFCEKKMFPEELRIINKGVKFSTGNEVNIGDETIRLSWHGRLFKNKHLVLAVVTCFTALYIIFLIDLNIPRQPGV